MAVTLRPITAENWHDIIKLNPADDQKRFVEPNLLSITEAQFIKGYKPLAIYADETAVGFLMYYYEDDGGGCYWIDRFMIGAEHQRRGYAKAALQTLITMFRAQPDCNAISLTHVEGNTVASKLYTGFGFTYTGERDENNEPEMVLPVVQPPDVVLKPITRDNWRECIKLEVDDAQKQFVAPNSYSLAEASFHPERVPLGVYASGQLVGFGMYNTVFEYDALWIYRLMIDKRHQGKGYGKAATLLMIEAMKQIPDCQTIGVSYVVGNTAAEKLYLSVGFEDNGMRMNNQIGVVMKVNQNGSK
jgi:diamine N-acetyltransferase